VCACLLLGATADVKHRVTFGQLNTIYVYVSDAVLSIFMGRIYIFCLKILDID